MKFQVSFLVALSVALATPRANAQPFAGSVQRYINDCCCLELCEAVSKKTEEWEV